MFDQPRPADELKPYEPAARIYCELRGIDPDEIMTVNHPLIAGAQFSFRHWQHAAERLIDLSLMLTALKRAKEAEQPKAVER